VSCVSIPFIAGQWSLLAKSVSERDLVLAFQSPSSRGSGRFFLMRRRSCFVCISFNPLHRGAVVASDGGFDIRLSPDLVSIPFIAGQWSLPWMLSLFLPSQKHVSIPFIAGQWSLQNEVANRRFRGIFRFNPLHRGAVVASGEILGLADASVKCFNPLHRGAVVASILFCPF